MKLCDVNVLVYAHRPDGSADHPGYAAWLKSMAEGPAVFGVSESVLSSFVRVVSNPRVFKDPTPIEVALHYCDQLVSRPNANILRPGPRNWEIFATLCRTVPARGKLVADAWHAALAMEYDCTWYSTDGDFVRFPGLKWRHPLQDEQDPSHRTP